MPSRTRSVLLLAAAFAVLANLASCSAFRSMFGSSQQIAPRKFNHKKHLAPEDQGGVGMECKGCHKAVEKDDKEKMMPAKKACTKCHEDTDEKLTWSYDKQGNPVWSTYARQKEEIIFLHGPHIAKKVGCLECHVGIDQNTGLVPVGMRLRMSACMDCHGQRAAGKMGCSVCHKEIDRETAPSNHEQMWKRLHGQAWRQGHETYTANDCTLCHANDTCITCHQTERPENHNQSWKFRPHGIAAGIDRSNCLYCHASDFCVRCHSETAPRSHTAGWNAPRNLHCLGCHLPLAANVSCFVCHKTTAGHDLAPPKPGWHSPTMVCRACHGGSMTHPDNGQDCNLCHR